MWRVLRVLVKRMSTKLTPCLCLRRLPVQPIVDHGLRLINRASVPALGARKLESLTQISAPRTT